jgi:hypothetical protein
MVALAIEVIRPPGKTSLLNSGRLNAMSRKIESPALLVLCHDMIYHDG